jgi:hypothetical protein
MISDRKQLLARLYDAVFELEIDRSARPQSGSKALFQQDFDIRITTGYNRELALISLALLRAMAVYSPSASTMVGNAPTLSETTSPPEVRIDQAVSAMASPPASATSLRVSCAARC